MIDTHMELDELENIQIEDNRLAEYLYRGIILLTLPRLLELIKQASHNEKTKINKRLELEEMPAHAPPAFIKRSLQKRLLRSPLIKTKYNQFIILLSYPVQKFTDKDNLIGI